MDELNFTELLKKYEAGTISEKERILLNRWYIDYAQKNPQHLEEAELENIFIQLQSEIFIREKNTRIVDLWKRIAVAASVIILFSAGGYWWFQQGKEHDSNSYIAEQKVKDISPGSKKAFLTLADGSKIAITDVNTGTLTKQGTAVIRKEKDGSIIYDNVSGEANANMINTLSTPATGETSVTLNDGTEVKLDALSSITYPVVFNGNERKVTVTGQVYFKVKHDIHKPFTVVAGNQVIKDIGTEFNINSYSNTKTTLIEGSVSVNGKMLQPGQEAENKNGNIVLKEVNLTDVSSWANGYFSFNNENIRSVMDKIKRWYDIDVIYEPGVTNEGMTGTISRYKNLSQVIYMLSYGQNIKFKIDGRRVTVMP